MLLQSAIKIKGYTTEICIKVKLLFLNLFARFYGFREVQLSHKVKIVGAQNITIGEKTKIFDRVELNCSNGPYLSVFRNSETTTGKIVVGANSSIKSYVKLITYQGFIEIGENVSINPYTMIYGQGGVMIGNNVMIASHCIIVSSNHSFDRLDIPMRCQGVVAKGICIEDDVWLGSRVTILDGVTVGKGAIVAAGAVVNSNVEPFTIVGGVPAKYIRRRYIENG